jgi:hypothetical protein
MCSRLSDSTFLTNQISLYEFVDMFMTTTHVLISGCKCGRNMASWRFTSFVTGIWRCILEEVTCLTQVSPQFPISVYRWGSEDSIGRSLCTSQDANIHFLLGWAYCSIAGIILHLNTQQFVFPVGRITRLKELVEDLGWQLNHMSLWRHSLLV